MGAVSNVLPAQRGLYVVIGAKLSRFQSRLRVYNIYGPTQSAVMTSYLKTKTSLKMCPKSFLVIYAAVWCREKPI